MYLFNNHFNGNIPVSITLSKVAGIGNRMATQACDQLGISKDVKLENLSNSQINLLNPIVHQRSLVKNDMRTLIKRNKTRLCSIFCLRGFWHIEGLPCRGQHTHKNARN
ncbi:hypothetical protein AMTRI_Chr01g103810 [Amborella trichopoda]